jgi:hypothetical protein
MLRKKSLFLFLCIFVGQSMEAHNPLKVNVLRVSTKVAVVADRVVAKVGKIAMRKGLVQLYQGADPVQSCLLVGGGATFFAVRACVQSKVLRNC